MTFFSVIIPAISCTLTEPLEYKTGALVSDNEAVSWSDYHAHHSNAETEIRQKISQELLQHMEFLDRSGAPECFIQGVERARNIVLYNLSLKDFAEDSTPQERLF